MLADCLPLPLPKYIMYTAAPSSISSLRFHTPPLQSSTACLLKRLSLIVYRIQCRHLLRRLAHAFDPMPAQSIKSPKAATSPAMTQEDICSFTFTFYFYFSRMLIDFVFFFDPSCTSPPFSIISPTSAHDVCHSHPHHTRTHKHSSNLAARSMNIR